VKDMSESWKNVRSRLDSLNLKKGRFRSVDKYEIPVILKEDDLVVEKLVPFGKKDKEGTGHFFLDDYAFERVWNTPKKYINVLKEFKDGVCSPDFSPYDDFPLAVQIYNVYRNRWCGRYWQKHGIKVIPTITWSGERSFEFAFEGVQKGSTVIISTVGLWFQMDYMELFEEGFEIMMEKIEPEQVIGYGKPVEGYDNVTWFKSFADIQFAGLK
jgi:hypothetical protein